MKIFDYVFVRRFDNNIEILKKGFYGDLLKDISKVRRNMLNNGWKQIDNKMNNRKYELINENKEICILEVIKNDEIDIELQKNIQNLYYAIWSYKQDFLNDNYFIQDMELQDYNMLLEDSLLYCFLCFVVEQIENNNQTDYIKYLANKFKNYVENYTFDKIDFSEDKIDTFEKKCIRCDILKFFEDEIYMNFQMKDFNKFFNKYKK